VKNLNPRVTDNLVRFVVDTGYPDLPNEVVEQSKACFMDSLGVALAGSKELPIRLLTDLMVEMGGNKQATILGKGLKTSVLNATLINGTASHVLDFDDFYQLGRVHVAASLVPAILSIAEWKHLSGKDAVTAFVLGFDVEARIADVVGPSIADRGWHATSCLGTFGSAVAAGKLLGLTVEQMTRTMGIAGVQLAGLIHAFGTMSKSFQVGNSAANGVLAALLGQRGFTSGEDILGAEKGIFNIYQITKGLEQVDDNLGKDYRVLNNGFKPYASCASTHPLIDAALELRRKTKVRPEEIAEIRCQVWPRVLITVNNQEPQTGLEGKFSVQHCIAVAFAEGEADLTKFTDAKVNTPELIDLRRKVTLIPDAMLSQIEAVVVVKTKDGQVYEQKIVCVKGNPGNPIRLEELENKFRSLACLALPKDNVERILKLLKELDKIKDINDLIYLCYE